MGGAQGAPRGAGAKGCRSLQVLEEAVPPPRGHFLSGLRAAGRAWWTGKGGVCRCLALRLLEQGFQSLLSVGSPADKVA